MTRRQRDLVLPVACLGTVLVLTVVAAATEPPQVAVRFAWFEHTAPPGTAIAFLPRWADLLLWPAMAAAALGATAWVAPRVRTSRVAEGPLGLLHGTCLLAVALRGVVLWANAGQARGAAVTLPTLGGRAPWPEDAAPLALMYVVFGCVLLGWVTAVVLSGRTRPRPDEPGPVPQRTVGTTSQVVWIGSSRLSPLAAAMTLQLVGFGLLVVAALGTTEVFSWWVLAVWFVLGAFSARHLWVQVTIGPQGLRARTGPWGVRFVVDWGDVVRLDVVEVDAQDGRPVRTRMGRRAVLRSGPALRVIQRTQSPLIVTVDEAEVGAAVAANHLGTDRVPALVDTVRVAPAADGDTKP